MTGWTPDRERLAEYRALLGSSAEIPLAFPQIPVMALHIDLLSQWSFPISAMGVVHQGTVVWFTAAMARTPRRMVAAFSAARPTMKPGQSCR